MSQEPDLSSFSFTQRAVLLSLVDGERAGQTPVSAFEIRSRCTELLDLVDVESLSTPAEQDIMRALNGLSADPAVREHKNHESPTGKGRPRYSLAVDDETILELLTQDDRFEGAIAAVEE
jgi:hypothetical protein